MHVHMSIYAFAIANAVDCTNSQHEELYITTIVTMIALNPKTCSTQHSIYDIQYVQCNIVIYDVNYTLYNIQCNHIININYIIIS